MRELGMEMAVAMAMGETKRIVGEEAQELRRIVV